MIFIYRGAADGKSKLIRWALKLQGKGFEVENVKGKANILADFCSRMPVEGLAGLIDEEAFDLSNEIPPTSFVCTALKEWR